MDITLRDYFAARAMQSLIEFCGPYEDDPSSPTALPKGKNTRPNVDEVAQYAYAQADAMLEYRATHDPNVIDANFDAIFAAVEKEREGCARMCEEWGGCAPDEHIKLANAIRKRVEGC